MLSVAHIEFIKKDITGCGLSYSHLQEDLTDHVCCDVEYEMELGFPFEQAYKRVQEKFGVGGLFRVQEETLFLIDKNYRNMKKSMRIFGLISPILIAFGTLFRIEHWPGAGVMLVLGFFLLSFFFLPSAMYVSYREVSNRKKLFTHIAGFLGFFLLSVSFLFKLQHWPGAGIMMVAGIMIICLLFLPIVLVQNIKNSQLHIPKPVMVIGFSGMTIYLLGFLFKVMHWPGAAILLSIGAVLLIVVAVPYYVYKKYKNEEKVENSFIFLIIVLVWIFIPTMLIAVNVSKNIAEPLHFNSKKLEINLEIASTQNKQIFSFVSKDSVAHQLHSKTQELIQYIDLCKYNIYHIAEIDFPDGPEANDINGIYDMVMFNSDKKVDHLSHLYQDYKKELEKMARTKEKKERIKALLDANFYVHRKYEHLLSSVNWLSLHQLSILQAEKICLVDIRKNNLK